MDNRYEIAEQNGISREFADWFFDNKKAGCGNVWFMMMAAMWEGWQGRAAMLDNCATVETRNHAGCSPKNGLKCAAMLQGSQPVSNRDELSSPVIPDGYALVPIVPTEDMVINGFESEPDPHFSDEKEWAKYEALSGCRRAAHRAKLCWAAMIAARPKLKHDLT